MIDATSATPRVGMFRSPASISNFSMDGYAESLSSALQARFADRFAIEEVRPGAATARRARPMPVVSRVVDFGARYPGYLRSARATRFDVNHVADHAYGHLAYVLDPTRTVITCHDIFPMKLWHGAIPGVEPRLTPPVTVMASLSGMRRARAIVTSTQATKDDLVATMGIGASAIHVVPYGLDTAFRRLSSSARAEAAVRFPLAGPAAKHILAVDTGALYKNQRATIEVLARVRAQSDVDVRLVRVGPRLSEDDRRLARSCGVADAIIELGPLPRAEVVSVYNLCDVLLFPSFYEGFGWPPVEAMACGLPVVTSRAAAIREVVGDAALQAEATDYDGLAAHVLCVLRDSTVASRLAERGRARASMYTWERAARGVAHLYGMIIEERAA